MDYYDCGGAIYNDQGNLTINNSTLNNNTGGYGGAISNYAGNLTINHSTFNNNNATYNRGGAIHNKEGTVTINNTKLNQNNATFGGAIYNEVNSNIIINYSTFNNNEAYPGGNGGAIVSEGTLTVNHSTFNNTSCREAIDNRGIGTINHSTFNNNTAVAIYNINGGTLTVNHSTFNNNTGWYCGAIYNYYGNLNINNSIFTNNRAANTQYGGAIYNYDNMTITNSVLVGNIGNYTIFNEDTVNASSNYWGNLNPTTDNLVNFDVDDYYRFLLTGVNSTSVGNEITLTSVFGLNTTDTSPWTGPTLNTAFTSNPTTATLTPNGDTVKFKPSTAGQYTVTANKAGGISTIAITVNNPTPIIKPTTTTLAYARSGSNSIFTATVKSGSALVSGVTVRFMINGKAYNVKTNSKGQAIKKIALTKSINTIYAQTLASSTYASSQSKSLNMKLANLKIIKIIRKSNRYYIYVKNYGKATSIKNSYLRLYYKRGKKIYSKTVRFNAIKAGKTLRVTINFYRYSAHRKYYKYAYVNYKYRSPEYNYKDNTKKFRK